MCTLSFGRKKCVQTGVYQSIACIHSIGTPISGPLLSAKALQLYPRLYPDNPADFKAGTGWLRRFKDRHGVRCLSLQGASLSAWCEVPISAGRVTFSSHDGCGALQRKVPETCRRTGSD